jgi:hypothetical protein
VAVKFSARALAAATQPSASIAAGGLIVSFLVGDDGRPTAQVLDTATGALTTQDIAALANFRARASDLAAYRTPDGRLHLALTDTDHHVWVISGEAGGADWAAVDLTGAFGFAGLSGDMTTYQPSWGTVHIAGLDARGHAINYWWAWDRGWGYDDLTAHYDGPALASGLTGYVTAWDGLNLAGVDSEGQIIVYWWAPALGAGNWRTQNMSADFGGPAISGQLDAFVTPWGGLNIVGTTTSGELYNYWWVPTFDSEPDRWRITNLSEQAGRTGAPALRPGVQAATSADGGINLFGVDATDRLVFFRWTPAFTQWSGAIGQSAASRDAAFPISVASAGATVQVLARAASDPRRPVMFTYDISTPIWQVDTPVPLPAVG